MATRRFRADRARGAVPTPASLARRLVEPLAARLAPGSALLDPGCGDGALLAAARTVAGDALRLHGLEIDPARAAEARARLGPGARIAVGDALRAPWPARAHVVANPPWASYSGRQAVRRPAHLGSAPAGGWPSLHGAFLVRIAEHVARERTTAAVLLPASVAALDGYARLRARVDALVLRGEVEELGENRFPGVTEPAILVRLEPHPGPAGDEEAPDVPRPWIARAPEDAAWLERLRGLPRLPERTFADPGVHTGNAARELLRRPPGDLPGVREGRCLSAFRLGDPVAGLVTTLERTPARRFRIRPRAHYASFPVLLRQTADRPIAALHERPTYFRNSLLAMRATPGLAPEFALAILNGPVAAAWHRASFRDAGQARFPQVKVGHLATQPFPIARRDDDPELHDRLAEMAARLARSGAEDPRRDRDYVRASITAFGLAGELAERVVARGR